MVRNLSLRCSRPLSASTATGRTGCGVIPGGRRVALGAGGFCGGDARPAQY